MTDHKDEEIKVVDRRMFNPDGSLRDDIVRQDAAPPAPAPEAPPPPVSESAPAQAAQEPEEAQEGGEEMNEFMEFLMQLSSSAFIYLGMMEHPTTGTRQVNLPAARQSIDMLVMLREKTTGNLTKAEDQFYEGLLSDLQMQYVSLTNRGPDPRR